MAASATFALKAGVWFRRGRLLMVSPDSQGTACPLSGRNSTYRPVQISGTGSVISIPLVQKIRQVSPPFHYYGGADAAARIRADASGADASSKLTFRLGHLVKASQICIR